MAEGSREHLVVPVPVPVPGSDADSATRPAAAALRVVESWVEQGWLRRLDLALARWVAAREGAAAPGAVVAVALLAHLEGQGHSCLDLAAPDLDACAPELRQALAGLDPSWRQGWESALRELDCVWARAAAGGGGAPRGADGTETAAGGAAHAGCDRGQPLVVDGGRLYLRRYDRCEQRIADAVRMRAATPGVAPAAMRRWLDLLFGPAGDAVDWQRLACAAALRSRLGLITGGPGTGKTYVAARLLALAVATAADPAGPRIALAAPTGKAAARLRQSIEAALDDVDTRLGGALPPLRTRLPQAVTLHSLLGARPETRRLRHHAGNPLDVDLLLVDEASMIHLTMMADLLDALPETATLVLLGDRDQLASVEAGAVLGDLCADAVRGRYRPATVRALREATGCAVPAAYQDPEGPELAQQVVMLRQTRRFGGAIGRLAEAVNRGDAPAARAALDEADPALRWIARGDAGAVAALAAGQSGAPGFELYLERLRAGPRPDESDDAWIGAVLDALDAFRVLCAVRAGPLGVVEVNHAVERALAARGLIEPGAEWYVGRPVLVTRNDPALGVFNGDVGVVLRDRDGAMRACFAAASGPRRVGVARLPPVETAYAMTVHKAQGSEFVHAALVVSGSATRELVYTGLTRARATLTLVTADPESVDAAVERVTRRGSGLAARLGA